MGQITQRPKLKPAANYALQDNGNRGWIANTMPMTFTDKEADRKTFTGDYLNQTAFEWQYTHKAIEVSKAAKPAPKPALAARPPTPKHWDPGMPPAGKPNPKFVPKQPFKKK